MKKTILALSLLSLASCGQVFGIKKLDAWGLKAEFNSGIGIGADIQQYDTVLDKKGMEPERIESHELNKY